MVNARVGRFTVDFLWPDLALVIEVDGYRYHRGARAFRDDRDRDVELGQLGFTVHRFADTRIGDDPTGVARATSQLIAQRQRSGAAFARQSGESRPG